MADEVISQLQICDMGGLTSGCTAPDLRRYAVLQYVRATMGRTYALVLALAPCESELPRDTKEALRAIVPPLSVRQDTDRGAARYVGGGAISKATTNVQWTLGLSLR
jgi:hypothetical protein